jgi:DNA-binding beta-propeller fold protein YncE
MTKKLLMAALPLLSVAVMLLLGSEVLAKDTVNTPNERLAPIYFDIAIDEAHQLIYGSDWNGNKIDVINMNTLTISTTLPIGSQPTGLDISPDGQELAVTLYGQGEIAFIDLNALTVMTRVVPSGVYGPNQPYDVLYGRSGRLYSVGNPGSSGFDYVHVFDTVTKVEVGRSMEIMRAAPRLAMTADHNTLYVSQVSFSPQKIYRFNISTDTPVQTAEAPHGPVSVNTLAVTPDGSQVYSSYGQVWNGDLNTQLGSFSPSGYEIEYVPSLGYFFVSSGSQVVQFDTNYYLPVYSYALSSTAGPARANVTGTVLYVSTAAGIEAIPLNVHEPVASMTISGAALGEANTAYAFTTNILPITATQPVHYIWEATDQSTVVHTSDISDSVSFTWSMTGTKYITVTAINAGGSVSSTHLITIIAEPVTDLTLVGPVQGETGVIHTFMATASPVSATLPIKFAWEATDLPAVVHTSNISDSVNFTWSVTGTKHITVTAVNAGGSVFSTDVITITSTPPDSVNLSGATTGILQTMYVFTASVSPMTTTTPVVYTWQTTEHNPIIHSGDISDVLQLSWFTPGIKTIAVWATNSSGAIVTASHTISIAGPPQPLPVRYFDIAIDDARQRIYGSDFNGNMIHVIDMATLGVSAVIPIGSQPTGMDISPDGQELAVTLYGQGEVAFIDLSALTVMTRVVPSGVYGPNQPYDVLYGRSGRLYSVGNPGSSGFDYVHVLDTVTKVEVGRSMEIMRAAPRLAMTADHNTLYVSQVSFSPQKIYRFNISTDTPVQTAEAPHGPVSVNTLAITPDGGQVYSSRGQVWNGDLNTQLGSFSPSGEEIEYVPGLNRFYISNGAQVSEFDGADYSFTRHYPLSAAAGVARINAMKNILYASTDTGIEAVHLVLPFQALEDLTIVGPTSGFVRQNYTFTATIIPITATQPITTVWQVVGREPITFTNAGINHSMILSWTVPAPQTIIVTATNGSSTVMSSHVIVINPYKQALEDLTIVGPTSGLVQQNYTFTATIIPITATQPITTVWQVVGREPITFTNAGINHSMILSWTVPSSQTIIVTATNGSSTVMSSHMIVINPYKVYLPILNRQ